MLRRTALIAFVVCALSAFAAPSRAFEEDTHFLMTYVICRSVGFTQQEALTVAAVDQGMDDSDGTVANSGAIPHVLQEWAWHALDKDGNMGPSGILARKHKLFDIAMSRPTPSDKLLYLGVFFHYQQDTYAHRHHYDGSPHSQTMFTTYNTPIGHAMDGHQPDRPPFDPVTAIMSLEDGIVFARDALKRGFNRQPRAFLATYQPLGGAVEENWSDKRNGKYFHQLQSAGAPGSAQHFLTDLIRAQINAYTSSFDANPKFFGRDTPDEASFGKVQAALQSVCDSYRSQLGETFHVPSKSEKEAMGFTSMTTERLTAAAPNVKNYVVYVKTGDVNGAGTDSNITLVMHGSARTSEGVVLNPLISGNAFERNQLDTATISGLEDVGTINSITVTSDDKFLASAWYLQYIDIQVDGKTRRFNCSQWIDKEHGLSRTLAGAELAATKNYTVYIKTGDKTGAGTDSNITLTIQGSKGSKSVVLNPLISGNAFERNNLDRAVISNVPDLGQINSLVVSSDDKYLASAWYLEYIEIQVDGATKRFNCNQWIDKDHGLTRTLR